MPISFSSAYAAINQYGAMIHFMEDEQTVIIPRQPGTPAEVLESLERIGRDFLVKRAHVCA